MANEATTIHKRARFRFDASYEIGLGHAYRCLTLAKALAAQNWTIDFAISETTQRIFNIGFGTILPIPDKLDVTKEPEHIKNLGGSVDLLVIDHYDRDYSFEKNSRAWAKKIFVIDDLANRKHDCDFLLDQTNGRSPHEYEQFVPRSCKILIGSTYALLRHQFALKRFFAPTTPKAYPVKKILISLGGTDPKNMTDLVIRAIQRSGLKVEVHVIGGQECLDANFPDLQIKRYNDVADMASLLMMADIAIGASGMSAWERCCLGLPTALIVTADNQLPNANGLTAAGAVRYLGKADDLDSESIAVGISELIKTPEAVIEMQNKARLLSDGLGVGRVICQIEQEFQDNHLGVDLRLATRADCEAIYLLHMGGVGTAVASTQVFATYSEYVSWFEASLNDVHCNLNIIQVSGVSRGVLRANADLNNKHFEISIWLDDSIQDLNIGSAALCLLSTQQPWACLGSQVDANNKGLEKMFLDAGFQREEQSHRFVKQPKVKELC